MAADQKSMGSVTVQVFEVSDDYRGADFHKPEGTFCAQYVEGVAVIYAWGTTEQAAVDHLRRKVLDKMFEQRIVRVTQLELQLTP